ncbi:MAG: chorismate lyase [Plectolyngbya sp. WJT66-NPBG17]|nr:chorismate lyase [Plectolyngbya sp. WJT66-NPBG17]MBW4525285.1 chorismate lyase [Phormidium tanganyikae FI6-MK23]
MTATFQPTDTAILPTTWHCLDPIWEASELEIQQGLPHSKLSPAWQMMLLGDGSPTRHLQLLTGEPTEVDVLDMSPIGFATDNAPSAIEQIPGGRLRRQIWLKTASGQRLGYATSWWESSHIDEYLQNRSEGVWANLSRSRMELYREIKGLHYGRSAALEAAFGYSTPLWGRHYLFWHHGKPFTLIYEVFSPYLEKYLGKARA